MKRITVLVIAGVLALNLSGCKESVSEDTYEQAEAIENTEVKNGSVAIEEVDETVDSLIEEDVEKNVNESENNNQENQETIINLQPASVSVDYGLEELKNIEGKKVENLEIQPEIEELLHSMYYNYFFTPSINMETGRIEASNMALFAISYIMQHDNEGLPFDYATYELTIPEEKVSEVVAQYFQRSLDIHQSYEAYKVHYDDEKKIYTVIIEDSQWEVDCKLNEIRQLNDTTYRITCDLPKKINAETEQQIEAIITYEDETPVLIFYNIRDAKQVTEEDQTEDQTEEEQTEE